MNTFSVIAVLAFTSLAVIVWATHRLTRPLAPPRRATFVPVSTVRYARTA